MKIIALLFLSVSAGAADYPFNKKVDPSALQSQIVAAGIKTDGISCKGTKCTIFNASADPTSIVAGYAYDDPSLAAKANMANITNLVKLLRAGTASQAQKDQLLSLLVTVLLSK